MPEATFRKTIELAANTEVADPALARITLTIVKRSESPEWWVQGEVPGPNGPVQTDLVRVTDLTDADTAAALARACIECQNGLLQKAGFTTDSPDVKPLPVKPVEPIEGGGGIVEEIG